MFLNSYKKKNFEFNRGPKLFSGVTWRIIFPFALLFHLIMVVYIWNQLYVNNPLKFETTPQQLRQYRNVQLFRDQMIFRKTVENNVLSQNYPIMYRKAKDGNDEISYYGLAAEAQQTEALNGGPGYDGPINLMFGRTDSAHFDISPRDYLYSSVVNIKNYVEYGPEFYACASFEVRTQNAKYIINVIQGCMMVKDLLYRWGSASRQFRNALPKVIPPEAHGATAFGINFHREQPCHMSANYYMNSTSESDKLLYSIPLKDVTYKPTLNSRRDGQVFDLIGTYFDGSLLEIKHLSYTYIIEQSVKKYKESNRFYALKTKIAEETSASVKLSGSGSSTVDTDMWIHGAKFKYDPTTKLCYMVNIGTIVFLHNNNAAFFVDRKNGKIVFNLYVNDDIYFLTTEKYALLIENDAKLCGIPSHNMTQN